MSDAMAKIAKRQPPCGRCDGSGFLWGDVSSHHCPDCQGRGWVMPRQWAVPEVPGPEVTAVRDERGGLWLREGDVVFRFKPESAKRGVRGVARGWHGLVTGYGPLTDASEEQL
jgi:hypothetical protein